MSKYFGVIGNRDYIKYRGERRPFWEFLDVQPDGWLTSLAYQREDLPTRQRMIFDCGAWSYRQEPIPKLGKNLVTPVWALDQYARHAKPGDFIIAPDHMLIPGVNMDARRDFNWRSAELFLPLSKNVGRPMVTIHGETLDERVEMAQQYLRLGYEAMALGGLAARASQKALVLDIVRTIRKSLPSWVWIHVLGLSSPTYAAAWKEYEVQSFDGSSHFKQAFTAGTFFTLADDGRMVKHKAAREGEDISAPTCYCRACAMMTEDGIDTRRYGTNESNMGRAAHNMNVLMRAQRSAMNGTVVLVSCVGEKRTEAAPAQELYQSAWFRKARGYAERHGDSWFILSAKHGLVSPTEEVAPYEHTLNSMTKTERCDWAQTVAHDIFRRIPKSNVVILAGEQYREHLVPLLLENGYTVDVPMRGLGIGQQLAWLDKKNTSQPNLF